VGMLQKVTHVGLDCHRKFSTLSARDATGKVVLREKLGHSDRELMRQRLAEFAKGTPVVLEGSFGWGWMSDELSAAGLDPHLASSSKMGGWRKARGVAKNNKLDADLLSEVWGERERWWEVWLAPVQVRDQRELLGYRMSSSGSRTSGALPATVAWRRWRMTAGRTTAPPRSVGTWATPAAARSSGPGSRRPTGRCGTAGGSRRPSTAGPTAANATRTAGISRWPTRCAIRGMCCGPTKWTIPTTRRQGRAARTAIRR